MAMLAAAGFLLAGCSAENADNADAGAETLLAGGGGGPIYTPPANQNISGVWWTQSYSPEIQLTGGGTPLLTEEGEARHEANRAALRADPLSDEARKFCTPDGVPRILGSPYPFEILQTPGAVTLIYELNRVVRHIALDVPLPSDEQLRLFPYYSGHSVGRWENDTLIVETEGYNDKTFIDATGLPHSSELRTIERVRKLDDGTLEIVVTVSDPATLREPFDARYVYDLHPGLRLQDYTCGEEHRDISHVPGVTAPN